MHCPHCSIHLEDGARFCGACGRRIDPPAAAPKAQSGAPAAPGPVPASAKAAAAKMSLPVSRRPVEPLAATMLGSVAPPAMAQVATPDRAAPSVIAPPQHSVPTLVASPQAAAATLSAPPPGSLAASAGNHPVRPVARPPEAFIGRTLNNRYVVEDKIGEGGFGAVFRGKQIATGREVALKILHPHNSGDPTIVARFRREAEACSKLRDPHTVTTYDFDETEDGILFLAMELLRGRSLHQLQKSEGPFPPTRVLGILDQVAESLGEAHQNGIVHRDMKPENVIVESRAGQDYVKVLDFGIAKMISGDRESQALTAVGQTLGTLEFMSPEQLRGIKLDGRSDIYALGMMAYEMLTGELPFNNAKSPIEIINFHMKDTCPPPSKMRPDLKISPALDEVLLKMVAKSRDNRFADTAALRAAIDEARHGKKASRPSVLADYRVVSLLGAVAVALVGALVYLLRR